MLTFIIGGVASGKSAYAERLIMQTKAERVYLATSQPLDDEMTAKIADHRAQRGPDWQTIEEPLNLAPVLQSIPEDRIVLLDCATLWLTNWMCADRDMDAAIDAFVDAIAYCAAPLVIVSNDLSGGLVPADAVSRKFQRVHGQLNTAIAARAELVVQVTVGLPTALKGTL
ncbi:bifunctional adenosylcobinamide kinase/adenosylcobinamide-phosphate guanylyltransferase [Aestuariibius sp. HNIBRBA575]|uniref:bifunctional adenosylcobinamide kinase/adenosylcobinamide-phosphate guanylyltransferase n=1 Tax=Aestuariibius sp. HNIBRBA575 TaxID=3233343 RepID=UPI0034A4E4C5